MKFFFFQTNLTPEIVRRNKPHVPAYALGHIQSSRSRVRSSRTHLTAEEVLKSNPSDDDPTRSAFSSPAAPCADDEFLREYLSEYPEAERPSIKLLATIHPSSKFRAEALFSDLAGRFPVTAFDGSIAVHHDFPVQVLHSCRAPPIPHRDKPRRRIHAHVSILQGPRPSTPVPSPRQRMPQILCVVLQGATRYRRARTTHPEARSRHFGTTFS